MSSMGVIQRLYLKNFLTYDEVQFQPRTGLNMIVGPNGSGKSSLVCGICLVLAGKPNVLGRAPFLKDFVKFGKTYAVLEIELSHPNGNVTIRRTIHNNRSEWKVNGDTCNQEHVMETVAAMNIQVNNLCQFLPQDRVADFVKMTPQQLLVGTEQAVGSASLMENHEKLKVLQKELAIVEDRMKASSAQLDKEVQLNERLETELNRLNEYRAARKHLDLYEAKLAWLNYVVKRNDYLQAKAAFREEAARLKERDEAKTKLNQKVTRMNKQMKDFDQQKTQLELAVRKTEEKSGKTREEIDKALERMGEIQHEFKEQLDADKERIEKEKALRATVEELEAQYAEDSESLQRDGVEDNLRGVKAQINGLHNELNQLNGRRQEKQQSLTLIDLDLRDAEEKLAALVKAPDARMEVMRRIKPHTLEACSWLEKNRNLFRGHIYKPVCVEISFSDDRAASYLETVIGADTLFSFVAENADDMELFVKETRRKGWKVNVGTTPAKSRENFVVSVPKERLSSFGVDGYVTDLFEAPDPVFTYLCELHQLHRIPYGGEGLGDHIYDLRKEFNLNRAIAGNAVVNIVKSDFSSDVTRVSKNINSNKILIVSTQRDRIEHTRSSLEQLKEKKQSTMEAFNSLKERSEELNRIARGLKEEEHKLVQRLGANRKYKDIVDIKKSQLSRLQRVPADLEKQKRTVENRLSRELTIFRESSADLAKDASKTLELLQQMAKLFCRTEKIDSQFESCREQLAEAERELTTIEASCARLDAAMESAKNEAIQALNQAKSLVGLENATGKAAVELPPEINAQFEKLSNDIAEIESFIAVEVSRLSLLMPHNQNVEREYKNRQKLIQSIKAVVDEHARTLTAIKEDIANRDRQWRSELDELIEKIDATFARFFSLLGCGGKVSLYTGEADHQYDRYGISIFVRFRENTDLCELTPTHQSGGERSVATILYMMALQELTVVPFRVIDEINQGMDSVNERRVFEFMVKTAEMNEAQYLLITPKLLTGLPYSTKMSIHFVHPNVKFSYHHWNLQKFIEQRRRSGNESSEGQGRSRASRSH